MMPSVGNSVRVVSQTKMSVFAVLSPETCLTVSGPVAAAVAPGALNGWKCATFRLTAFGREALSSGHTVIVGLAAQAETAEVAAD